MEEDTRMTTAASKAIYDYNPPAGWNDLFSATVQAAEAVRRLAPGVSRTVRTARANAARAALRRRTEAKFACIGTALFGLLCVSQQMHLLAFLEPLVEGFISAVASAGFIGIFIAAAVANASLVVHIPYTLPVISLALSGASLGTMLWAGVWAGLGCGVGEIGSYYLAHRLLGSNRSLAESGLFRWVTRNIEGHPRLIPAVVFAFAVSPLPDDCVIIPLGMMRYGLRRILVPLFAGKIIHTTIAATLIYYLTNSFKGTASSGAEVDFALGVLVVLVLGIFYQAEKARTSGKVHLTAVLSASRALTNPRRAA
jgi:hypothetical protein